MYTNQKQNNFSKIDDSFLDTLSEKLTTVDRIVIGAGAGLSASAGLNYTDTGVFERLYTPFLKKGYRTIADAISHHWYLTEDNASLYWGFWSHHINTIFYSHDQLDTYRFLYDTIKDKNYFVITTNGDGQFFKGNFDPDKIFAMQGNYGLFQCQIGCHNTSYDNKEWIQKMVLSFDKDTLEISKEVVPRCPKCGVLLCPNLRIDHHFVESTLMHNAKDYLDFVSVADESILFLELGVGFNTPVIIRYPFEQMTRDSSNATLFRVNSNAAEIPNGIQDKGFSTTMDIHTLLKELRKK